MSRKTLLKLSLFFTLLIVFLSCRKKPEAPEPLPGLETEREISLLELDLVQLMADVHLRTDTSLMRAAKVTESDSYQLITGSAPLPYTHTLVRTYTDSTGAAGTLTCYFKGARRTGTYADSVVLDSIKMMDRRIHGTMVTVQTAVNKDSWVFRVRSKATSGSDGKTANVTSDKQWIKFGIEKDTIPEHYWHISGTAMAVSGTNEQVQLVHTSPMVIRADVSFRFPIKGVIDFSYPENSIVRRIRFGNSPDFRSATYINEKGLDASYLLN